MNPKGAPMMKSEMNAPTAPNGTAANDEWLSCIFKLERQRKVLLHRYPACSPEAMIPRWR